MGFREVVESIEESSIMQVAGIGGVIGGMIYHLICQFPQQKDVLSCLSVIALSNCLLGLKVLLSAETRSTSSWIQVIQAFCLFNSIFTSIALVLKVVYNVYFRHRGIPTKFSLSASDWMLWRYCQAGTSHFKVAQLHQELGNLHNFPTNTGDVVRIQPNHISFISLSAVEQLHSTKSRIKKGDFYYHVLRPGGMPGNLLTTTDKGHHSFLRRLCGPSFTSASMNEFEPVLEQYCSRFLEAIEVVAKEKGAVDMNDWFNRFSFDIAGQISLGQTFGSLDGKEGRHYYIEAFHKYIELVQIFMFVPWLAQFLLKFPPPKSLRESRQKCLTFIKNSIENDSTAERTVIGNILKASDPETGAKFSFFDVLVNANVFINAASDTTAATLTFVLYYVLANPEAWTRLVQEVRSQFSSEEEISGHSTAPLPFLNAVIHETLRLRPPAPSNLQRVVPDEGMMIDGYYIPPGTVVSTPTYGIMHDPRHFSHPDDFIPTRWIPNEKGQETCNRAAWIPFSYGPRSCIGKPLALIELRLVIARFVWRFDAELVEDKEPYYQDAFVARRGDLPIKIWRRELQK